MAFPSSFFLPLSSFLLPSGSRCSPPGTWTFCQPVSCSIRPDTLIPLMRLCMHVAAFASLFLFKGAGQFDGAKKLRILWRVSERKVDIWLTWAYVVYFNTLWTIKSNVEEEKKGALVLLFNGVLLPNFFFTLPTMHSSQAGLVATKRQEKFKSKRHSLGIDDPTIFVSVKIMKIAATCFSCVEISTSFVYIFRNC